MTRVRLFFTLFLSLTGIAMIAQPARQITMEDVWAYYRFFPNNVSSFQFQQDGTHYTRLEQGRIVQYDITTGEQTAVVFDPSALGDSSIPVGSYSFTGDE
ncbi:MAG: S9 family peptidase, partial [Bacteroidota bacterium]